MPQDDMAADLKELLLLCQRCLGMAEQENRPLAGGEASPAGLAEQRKGVLPDLDAALGRLRRHRSEWLRLDAEERSRQSEVSSLMRRNMDLIWRIIALDRENEGLLLRHGRVPVARIPATAAQQPHFVANLYRRNNTGS